jgi:phage baseplate assembly protein W
MAIEIKRPALDFNVDVAIGIDLPMGSFVGSQFTLNYLSLDQAVANAKNLLLTNHGERPMRPLWGCNLRKSLFENIDSEGSFFSTIKDTIRDNFSVQLPYINIAELFVVQPDTNPNQVHITLSISLKGNEFDTRQIDVTIDIPQA